MGQPPRDVDKHHNGNTTLHFYDILISLKITLACDFYGFSWLLGNYIPPRKETRASIYFDLKISRKVILLLYSLHKITKSNLNMIRTSCRNASEVLQQ